MLVGRRALRQAFLVDSRLSYAGGRPARATRHRTGAGMSRQRPRASFAIGTVRVRASHAASRSADHRLVTGADVSPARPLPSTAVTTGRRSRINAAIHGDEVIGVEVIHKVLCKVSPKTIRGTLLAVPIVNVLGFMNGDRYLPDRRDLNRSFPGSARGRSRTGSPTC